MITTIYTVSGMRDDRSVRAVKDRVSTVAGVGGVAIELEPTGESKMFVKHKDDVALDRSAIEAAVREAGGYAVI